jgi:hypothetical protein
MLSVAACGGRDDQRTTDTVGASRSTYSIEDFRRLRWLDGRWRGVMADGKNFFEQYRFLDDSTIVMHAFTDSTFAQANDSARITLRGGIVADEGGAARWVATRLDTLGAEFSPERGAQNHFAWSRESNDAWTATLRWMDEQGRSRSAVYSLQRFGR